MPKYVAFLRAINVGGHTVKMDHLRNLFEAIGFSKVETFIASGNVIFETKSQQTQSLERKIKKHLHQALGYEVKTFIRTTPELATIAKYNPFDQSEPDAASHTVYIGFVNSSPDHRAKQKLLSLSNETNEFHVHEREIYWLCRAKKFSEAEFSGAVLEKILGMRTTLRNVTTVKRLVAKYSG
jgi:uncharacterized protein (DUF1697 family)